MTNLYSVVTFTDTIAMDLEMGEATDLALRLTEETGTEHWVDFS